MALIAFVADVHVANHKRWGGAMDNGVNRRATEVLDALASASKRAASEGADAFVVLGDLFDHTRPTPQLVRATAEALLAGHREDENMNVIVLLGNHDIQSDGELDHACASLALVPGIEVVAKPLVRQIRGVELILAPYQPGLASEWLPSAITACVGGRGRAANQRRLLATHLGIWDEGTPSFMKSARDAVSIGQMRFWCDANEIEFVFAGNWHAYQHFDGKEETASAVIPGTLAPAGFQEPDQNKVGWMVTFDTAYTQRIRRIPIKGPRFITINANDQDIALRVPAKEFAASRRYVRIRCAKKDMDQAISLRHMYENGGDVALIMLDEDVDTLVRKAASEAVAASNGAGPVADYVGLTEVSPPGTKEGVAKRLAEYRKAAQ